MNAEALKIKLVELVIKNYGFLNMENPAFYTKAARRVREMVDELLRPASGVHGERSLDAYRFYHDKAFVPASFQEEVDGRVFVPLSLLQQLQDNPMGLFCPNGWGRYEGWSYAEKYGDIASMVTHFALQDDRMTVWYFLKCTEEKFPEYYAEVLALVIAGIEESTGPDRYR